MFFCSSAGLENDRLTRLIHKLFESSHHSQSYKSARESFGLSPVIEGGDSRGRLTDSPTHGWGMGDDSWMGDERILPSSGWLGYLCP